MTGVVRLRIEGLMLERLVQRALAEGAFFRMIQRRGPRVIILEANPAGAEILTALCERFSISCVVLSRRGPDAAFRRLKKRSTILAGIAAGLCVVALFLSRVWLIDIELAGDRTADIRPLKAALSALGIRPGISRSALDAAMLEDTLSAGADGFSFIGVRLQGVRLLVEAAPAVPAPELYTLDGSSDLVAKCDGIVTSINVLSGIACVKPGDTVIRGQVLIRGDERISKEETRSISAMGSVTARTWHTGTARTPTLRTETRRTGRASSSAELRLMGFALPLLKGESYSMQEEESETFPIGGLFLPLEIRRTTAWETTEATVSRDESLLKSQLSALAFAEAYAALTETHPDGCEIADRWIKYTTDSQGIMHARAVCETLTDIAVARDVLYQQGG